MINVGSLVLHKNILALVSAVEDGRISILLEGRELKKVRDKDLVLLHRGPCKTLPAPRGDGDFETARSMIVSEREGDEPVVVSWDELAELVFGDKSPDSLVGCVRGVLESDLFRIIDGFPAAQSDAILAKLRDRELQKQKEAELRKNFTSAFSGCLRQKSPFDAASRPEFARFVAELENFARGSGERNALVADCGLAESRELVHQALVTTGIWKPYENLWPARAGCVLYPSRVDIDIGLVRGDEIPRIDLTYLRSYAIDNAWSNDPDDAVSIEGDHVWVHVADPAAFFGPGSEVDAEALRRGATLYLPEIIVPMLPSAMMDRLGLGLNPSSEALSFKIRLDEAGGIVSTEIMPSTLQVTRLYYSRADELLQSGDADLAGLQACAAKRRQRRILNGAVEIDFPEVSMKAEAGEVRFVPVPETTSSGIVQEMMLLAGEAAARWAWERKLPFTYSSQEAPQLPRDFPLSDTGEKFLSTQYQRRKGMRASIVGTEPQAHHGLGLSFYSQVTSPLRRYQDLLAHYQLRSALLQDRSRRCLSADEVSRLCLLAGQGSSATRQAERDSRLHWIAYYLSSNPGWTGTATVMDTNERETAVFIQELGLETALRTRIPPEIDSRVRVKLTRAVVAMRDIGFELSD
jgi:exoribonuclease-2